MKTSPNFWRTLSCALAVLVPATCLSQASAADWKPSGTMRIIVASSPGGAHDLLARAMGKTWRTHFGVNVIVQNAGGAGGLAAWDQVAKAKPDGLTIGFSSSSPYLLERSRNKNTFNWALKDVPVVLGASAPPVVIVTGAKSDLKSWADVRSGKRRISMGVPGALSMEITALRDLTNHKVELTTASFGSAAKVLPVLEAGDVDLFTTIASLIVLDPIKMGRVRPLLVVDTKRFHLLPDTPALPEVGIDGKWADASLKRIWFAPIGTPPDVQKAIAGRLRASLSEPETKAWASKNGLVDEVLTGEQVVRSLEGFLTLTKESADLFKKYSGR